MVLRNWLNKLQGLIEPVNDLPVNYYKINMLLRNRLNKLQGLMDPVDDLPAKLL